MQYAFGSLTVLLISGITLASCPPRVRVVHHAQAVVVKKEVIAQFVPVAVYQPLAVVGSVYGGAYIPPAAIPPVPIPTAPPVAHGGQPASATNQSDLQLILTALQSMDSRLKALEGRTPPGTAQTPPATPQTPPNPSPTTPVKPPDPFAPRPGSASSVAAPEHPAVAIFRTACISCHEASKAKEEGGGFAMFQGTNLDLSKADGLQVARIGSRVYNNTMPPKKTNVKLTDEQVGTIIDFVDQYKRK